MLNESRTVKVFVKRLIQKLSPGNIMARRFNRQNFMQQWATASYSRDKIDLIQYCQGQALVSVQKLCWNCQRIMHLERDRTFQDGWRWYKRFCTCISFTTRRLIRRTVIIGLSFLLFWKWNYFWFVFLYGVKLDIWDIWDICVQRERDFILHSTQAKFINQGGFL